MVLGDRAAAPRRAALRAFSRSAGSVRRPDSARRTATGSRLASTSSAETPLLVGLAGEVGEVVAELAVVGQVEAAQRSAIAAALAIASRVGRRTRPRPRPAGAGRTRCSGGAARCDASSVVRCLTATIASCRRWRAAVVVVDVAGRDDRQARAARPARPGGRRGGCRPGPGCAAARRTCCPRPNSSASRRAASRRRRTGRRRPAAPARPSGSRTARSARRCGRSRKAGSSADGRSPRLAVRRALGLVRCASVIRRHRLA